MESDLGLVLCVLCSALGLLLGVLCGALGLLALLRSGVIRLASGILQGATDTQSGQAMVLPLANGGSVCHCGAVGTEALCMQGYDAARSFETTTADLQLVGSLIAHLRGVLGLAGLLRGLVGCLAGLVLRVPSGLRRLLLALENDTTAPSQPSSSKNRHAH